MREIRIESGRLLIVGQRRLQFTGEHVQRSAIGIRLGKPRIQFDRMMKVVKRRLELARLGQAARRDYAEPASTSRRSESPIRSQPSPLRWLPVRARS